MVNDKVLMMSTAHRSLKIQILDTCRWAVCLPALACWPILSALPAFAIVGRSNSDLILPNIMFFMTGFWPVLTGFVAYNFVVGRLDAAGMASLPRLGGLLLGSLAMVWTVAYGVFVFVIG